MKKQDLTLLNTRKHVMTLFAGTVDAVSHRTRIVLFEKDVECQIVEVEPGKKPRRVRIKTYSCECRLR